MPLDRKLLAFVLVVFDRTLYYYVLCLLDCCHLSRLACRLSH